MSTEGSEHMREFAIPVMQYPLETKVNDREEVEGVIARAKERARTIFDEGKAIFAHITEMYSADTASVAAMRYDIGEKNMAAASMRNLVKQLGPSLIIQVMEAWTKQYASQEEMEAEHSKHKEIRLMPDREEIVCVLVEHVRFGRRGFRARIHRHGDAVVLGEWDDSGWETAAQHTGRFMGYLEYLS
jgi:hypothetical protein